MPVIVVGADTPIGRAIVPRLRPASGELRVFVSNPDLAEQYRTSAKVAVGDVSDGSHVGGAAIGAFCAVLIMEATRDGRERSFADSPASVLAQWADGLGEVGLGRIIVVGTAGEMPSPNPLPSVAAEFSFVDTVGSSPAQVAAEVARLEAAREI
jgi:hypothetical protein